MVFRVRFIGFIGFRDFALRVHYLGGEGLGI